MVKNTIGEGEYIGEVAEEGLELPLVGRFLGERILDRHMISFYLELVNFLTQRGPDFEE